MKQIKKTRNVDTTRNKAANYRWFKIGKTGL